MHTIVVSIPMVQRMYAPIVDGRSSLNDGVHYLNVAEFNRWRDEPTSCWSTFSIMFDNVHTIIVRSLFARGKVDGLLAFAKSKESAEEIIYE